MAVATAPGRTRRNAAPPPPVTAPVQAPRAARTPQRASTTAAAARAPVHEQPTHEKPRARTRTRTGITATAPNHDSYINFEAIPKDISLNWKLFTAEGKEYPFYLQAMRKQGWEPVNPKEHPNWLNLPPSYPHTSVIVDGLILCERPKHLTDEAVEDDRNLANDRIRQAEQRLGKTRKDTVAELRAAGVIDHADVGAKLIKEVGRMIPVEE